MTLEIRPDCGAASHGIVCEKPEGHSGDHRGYNAAIDEAMFWPNTGRRTMAKPAKRTRVSVGGKDVKLRPNEMGLTIRLVGDPAAVIEALAHGLPKEALEELALKLQAELEALELPPAEKEN